MSDRVASYAFLPWLRRGIARDIERHDGTLDGEPRVKVPIDLGLSAGGAPREVTARLELFGPGEVAALDPGAVVRTVPRPDEADAEPNYFPAIEFGAPDLPWRFTPARAEPVRGRLRPWLVLVVLAEEEIEEATAAGGDGRLAAVTVTDALALPPLAQSWAWAHTQVDGFDPASEDLERVVRDEPQRVRSRLLAPRRLRPGERYRALLVPALKRGRRAGLGEPPGDADALLPAWEPGETHVRLPIYYGWSFQTGEVGDFETLARRLRARPVDADVGLREMDVSAPDPALPAAAPGPLAMEGALVATNSKRTPWGPAERDHFVTALAELLNRPAEALATAGTERTVAPPLWVRWQAAKERLADGTGPEAGWFADLNADPRNRAVAGLGAEVVRANDQQLMAEAWSQVEGIVEANAELRRTQLSRAASVRLLERHLAPLAPTELLEMTVPLHTHVTLSPETVRAAVRRSPIAPGALSGGLRRVLRPGGPTARRMGRVRAAGREPLLERLNAGEVRAQPPAKAPAEMTTLRRLFDGGAAFAARARGAIALLLVALLLALLSIVLAVLLWPLGGAALVLGAASAYAAWRAWRTARRARLAGRLLAGEATPAQVSAIPPAPGFVPAATAPGKAWSGEPEPLAAGGGAADTARRDFRRAFADLVGEVGVAPRAGPRLVPAELPAVAGRLLDRIDPALTMPAAIETRLTIAEWVTWEQPDPLEPIMAAPLISTPMYEPLCDLSQEWLMPGLGTIPPDTTTLLKTNQRFIEAYMAGLSHEMSRELLYHEFPTDQRGTYFHHFWDWRGVIRADGDGGEPHPPDPEKLRDVKDIRRWQLGLGLGRHTGRVPPPPAEHLVLLVKGEVLRRYPTTLVYAIPATIDDDGRRTLGEGREFPIFEGRLDPDVSFFGFELLPDQVRGDPGADPEGDLGWYFVLQEQPSEPVFGLDPDDGRYAAKPASWNDLNWAQLAEDEAELEALRYIDLDAQLPDTSAIVAAADEPALAWHAEAGAGPSGANGSDLAYATLQRPFRVAIHGSDMLPAGESS